MRAQMKTRTRCQCALHVSLPPRLFQKRKLPRDHGPFLEMLLNHHNPPQSVCIQSITGQPPSITFLAAASRGAKPYLRAVPVWDACAGFWKAPPHHHHQGTRGCFALNWTLYHFSLACIRMQTSLMIDTQPIKAVCFFCWHLKMITRVKEAF